MGFTLTSRYWWLLIKYEFVGSYYIDIIKDLKIVYTSFDSLDIPCMAYLGKAELDSR